MIALVGACGSTDPHRTSSTTPEAHVRLALAGVLTNVNQTAHTFTLVVLVANRGRPVRLARPRWRSRAADLPQSAGFLPAAQARSVIEQPGRQRLTESAPLAARGAVAIVYRLRVTCSPRAVASIVSGTAWVDVSGQPAVQIGLGSHGRGLVRSAGAAQCGG